MIVQVSLPTYEECEVAVQNGSASALQRFIYENEPAGIEDQKWRRELRAALNEIATKLTGGQESRQ
jgi:hypothetical protein